MDGSAFSQEFKLGIFMWQTVFCEECMEEISVSVAQRLASFTMPLDVVFADGLAFHDSFEGGFAVDDVGVGESFASTPWTASSFLSCEPINLRADLLSCIFVTRILLPGFVNAFPCPTELCHHLHSIAGC